MIRRAAAWRSWQWVISGSALGAVAAFGQEPYNLPVAMLVSIAAAFWLFRQVPDTRKAALLGWAFGFGYFAHALQWLVSPFMVDVARHGWMAPFALLFMAGGLALFWGAAFALARRLSLQLWPLAVFLTGAELLRAYVFTGFPWAMPSQAIVGVLAGQSLAYLGPHGLTLALLLLLGLVASSRQPRFLRTGAGVLMAVTTLLPPHAPEGAKRDLTIRLVQPNAPQREKWDPEKIPVFFDRQLEFTAAPPKGDAKPNLIIWPETAIPWLLENAGPVLPQIAQAAGDTPVALGLQRYADDAYFNSMAVLGAGGAVTHLYDKHHLVPFGEYIPFARFLSRFGLQGLAGQAGGYGAGPGAQVLDLGPLGKALPLICYEAVFAQDVNAAPERPDFLIQITNDGWFGKGAGPRQHLAQARMRSIEQGLPLARAANTGISAMIDPWGRLMAEIPLHSAGFFDVALPAPRPPTLYSRTGDWPTVLLVLIGVIAAFATRRKV